MAQGSEEPHIEKTQVGTSSIVYQSRLAEPGQQENKVRRFWVREGRVMESKHPKQEAHMISGRQS